MVRCTQCEREFATQDALAMHTTAKHYVYEEKKPFNKIAFGWGVSILIIIILLGYGIWSNNNDNSLTGNVVGGDNFGSGETQKIILSMKNFNYYPNTIRVKEGVPVEIVLDNSVKGCYRSFMIKDLGLQKYSADPSKTITFVPTKKGTFEFACSMRMGRGTIIVE